ncbi:unnamed protein product [Chrysoparadoxa australica]
MDLEKDQDLFWIAKEGLKAPLPENWKPCKTVDTDEIYYFNFCSGESTWDHPCDEYYRRLYEEEKKKKLTETKAKNDKVKQQAKKDVNQLLGKKKKRKSSVSSPHTISSSGDLTPVHESPRGAVFDRKPLPGIGAELSNGKGMGPQRRGSSNGGSNSGTRRQLPQERENSNQDEEEDLPPHASHRGGMSSPPRGSHLLSEARGHSPTRRGSHTSRQSDSSLHVETHERAYSSSDESMELEQQQPVSSLRRVDAVRKSQVSQLNDSQLSQACVSEEKQSTPSVQPRQSRQSKQSKTRANEDRKRRDHELLEEKSEHARLIKEEAASMEKELRRLRQLHQKRMAQEETRHENELERCRNLWGDKLDEEELRLRVDFEAHTQRIHEDHDAMARDLAAELKRVRLLSRREVTELTTLYEERKAELSKKIDQAEADLRRQGLLDDSEAVVVQELERELQQARDQAAELEASLKHSSNNSEVKQLKEEVRALREKLSDAESVRAMAEREKDAKAALAREESAKARELKEDNDRVVMQLASLRAKQQGTHAPGNNDDDDSEDRNAYSARIARLEEQLVNAEMQRVEALKTVAEKEVAADSAAQEEARMAETVAQLKTASSQLEESLAIAERKVNELEADVIDRTVALQAAKAEQKDLSDRLDSSQCKASEAVEGKKSAEANVVRLEKKLHDLLSERAAEAQEETAKSLAELQLVSEELECKHAASEAKGKAAAKEIVMLRDRLANLESQLDEEVSQRNTLELKLSDAQELLDEVEAGKRELEVKHEEALARVASLSQRAVDPEQLVVDSEKGKDGVQEVLTMHAQAKKQHKKKEEEMVERLHDLEELNDSLLRQLEDQNRRRQIESQKIKTERGAETQRLAEELENFNQELTAEQNRHSHFKASAAEREKKLKGEIVSLASKLAEARGKAENAEQQMIDLRKRQEDNLKAKEQLLDEQELSTKGMQQQLLEAQKALVKAESEAKQHTLMSAELEQNLASAQRSAQVAQRQLERVKASEQQLMEQAAQLQLEVTHNELKQKTDSGATMVLEERVQALTRERDALLQNAAVAEVRDEKGAMESLKGRTAELVKERDELIARVSDIELAHSRGGTVRKVLEEQVNMLREERNGLVDRLSQLELSEARSNASLAAVEGKTLALQKERDALLEQVTKLKHLEGDQGTTTSVNASSSAVMTLQEANVTLREERDALVTRLQALSAAGSGTGSGTGTGTGTARDGSDKATIAEGKGESSPRDSLGRLGQKLMQCLDADLDKDKRDQGHPPKHQSHNLYSRIKQERRLLELAKHVVKKQKKRVGLRRRLPHGIGQDDQKSTTGTTGVDQSQLQLSILAARLYSTKRWLSRREKTVSLLEQIMLEGDLISDDESSHSAYWARGGDSNNNQAEQQPDGGSDSSSSSTLSDTDGSNASQDDEELRQSKFIQRLQQKIISAQSQSCKKKHTQKGPHMHAPTMHTPGCGSPMSLPHTEARQQQQLLQQCPTCSLTTRCQEMQLPQQHAAAHPPYRRGAERDFWPPSPTHTSQETEPLYSASSSDPHPGDFSNPTHIRAPGCSFAPSPIEAFSNEGPLTGYSSRQKQWAQLYGSHETGLEQWSPGAPVVSSHGDQVSRASCFGLNAPNKGMKLEHQHQHQQLRRSGGAVSSRSLVLERQEAHQAMTNQVCDVI